MPKSMPRPMPLPDLIRPPTAVFALAAFVRERLSELTEALTPLRGRLDAQVPAATARQVATVIAGAAAPFAPTSYARARLIRQMHASGLLTAGEARYTETLLAATGTDSVGVPRPKPGPRA